MLRATVYVMDPRGVPLARVVMEFPRPIDPADVPRMAEVMLARIGDLPAAAHVEVGPVGPSWKR
jgi:hypothetical protein